ncbi:MAG TPA: tRNA lysidine(34) synthetase TilS, partial [Vicinamibacterales bacterium]|nr:tRNA lysidine(34) synthetase TilS [Vicinamibacterales bacterium]
MSGGSDSVALAHALHQLAADGDIGDLRFAGLVHFNHLLRDTSNDDEALCGRLAATLGVPFVSGRGDVRGRAASEHRSIEDAARRARYEFFERARVELGAAVVALGHTRDDQAETFLLRLIRGAGPRGLAGMYPRNGAVVRPLLACRRAELREWLAERAARGGAGTAFVDDETNQDVSIPRNRVRAELLPLLESRFNSEIVDVLADEADLARDSWTIVERAAELLGTEVTGGVRGHERGQTSQVGSEVDVPRLLAADPALARVVLWRALTAASGGREIGYGHVAAAMDLVREGGDRSIDIPGLRVQRIGSRLVLVSRPAGARGRWAVGGDGADAENLYRHTLSIPGEVHLSFSPGSCTLSAEALKSTDAAAIDRGASTGRG